MIVYERVLTEEVDGLPAVEQDPDCDDDCACDSFYYNGEGPAAEWLMLTACDDVRAHLRHRLLGDWQEHYAIP